MVPKNKRTNHRTEVVEAQPLVNLKVQIELDLHTRLATASAQQRVPMRELTTRALLRYLPTVERRKEGAA